MKLSLFLIAVVAATGCSLRAQRAESTAAAYDVRPLRGQDADQMRADVEACKARLVREPGQLEPRTSVGEGPVLVPSGWNVAVEAERAQRYERCLAERGYEAEPRPMSGGAGDRR